MATKRQRRGRWEYRVVRKGLLPRPCYLTFATEAEGDEYVARLEALLDRGVVPPELLEDGKRSAPTLRNAVRDFLSAVAVTADDRSTLAVTLDRLPDLQLRDLSFAWAQAWVTSMKRQHRMAPGTIRHHVGALARALDWVAARGDLVANPLRMLPRGYSRYTEHDAAFAGGGRVDQERDRRLVGDEEQRIRAALAGEKRPDRQRALELREREALVLLFDLALETAMRMRELFTLEVGQVDLSQRTIFLDRSKNGDRRQVPLSSVALAKLRDYIGDRRTGLLFPWWDGQRDTKTLKRVTSQLSRQWGRVFEYAGCEDLHWHDLRHEATSRLFERSTLDALEISRITGHRDPRMLRRYANLRGSDLADRLW